MPSSSLAHAAAPTAPAEDARKVQSAVWRPLEVTAADGTKYFGRSALYGFGEPGLTVRIYDGTSCTGPAIASGSADARGGFEVATPLLRAGDHVFSTRIGDGADRLGRCSVFATRVWAPGRVKVAARPRVYTVHTQAEAEARIPHLAPGDTLVLAAGTYADLKLKLPVTVRGTLRQPITVRPAAPAAVTLTGMSTRLAVDGEYIHVKGFRFVETGENTVVLGGRGNKLIDSTFTGCGNPTHPFSYVVQIAGGSLDNEVSGCSFTGTRWMSISLRVAQRDAPMPPALRTVIRGNLFKDIPKVDNGAEPIQMGQASGTERYATHYLVERNRFIGSQGDPELISIKTSMNLVRDNYAENTWPSKSDLVLRAGKFNRVEGNVLVGAYNGIRVFDSDNQVVNNVIKDAYRNGAIVVRHACSRNLIADNTIIAKRTGLSIWEDPKVPVTAPAQGNLITNNIFFIRERGGRAIDTQSPTFPREQVLGVNTFKDNVFWWDKAPVTEHPTSTIPDLAGNRHADPALGLKVAEARISRAADGAAPARAARGRPRIRGPRR